MRKRLNKDITGKVEAFLIKALSDIADLNYFPIVKEDEKKIFARQFTELSIFLSTWGLSEHYIRRIKRRAIYNPIEDLDKKSLMLEKVRNGKKIRTQLKSEVLDYIEKALIDAVSELANEYYLARANKEIEQQKLYIKQYGELYIFLSDWGIYDMLDWQDELPLDVMDEIKAEAGERERVLRKENSINTIQQQWQENKVSASSGFLFQNSEFVEFELTILNINQKFIFNQVKEDVSRCSVGGWTKCFIKNSLIIEDVKSKIVVGSCSLGSDGFIAYISNNNELIWSIYSEHTGAFREIEYKDNAIIVESRRGYRYLIPLHNPLEIKDLETKSSLDIRKCPVHTDKRTP